MSRQLLSAALAALCVLAFAPAATAASCSELSQLSIAHARVVSAVDVSAGAFTPPGEHAQALADLPAFCRVVLVSTPTPQSEIGIEVWVPANWNGRFQGVGTGGYQGAISYGAMAMALHRGYAVASTDMGHVGDDLSFGAGNPERVRDWAYRAIHEAAVLGRLIVRNVAGRFPDYSYFVGCASGGHQAISQVERYPDDYDGVIAGNPANNRLHETAAYIWAWRALHDERGAPILELADLQLVTHSAIEACDSNDGVRDGVIDDPRRCRFDVGSLLCAEGRTRNCLTAAQIVGVRKVHAGLRNPRTGDLIFPGWPIGSEGYGETARDSWMPFLVAPTAPMRSDVYKYFLFHNPSWDHRTFDFDRDVAYADEQIGYVSAVSSDYGAFRARGGRLIMYTGWSDPVLPAPDVISHYEDIVRTTLHGERNDFVRFFLVPGMGHCSGGPGPTSFDMLPALEAWVERDEAPERVVAAHTENGAPVRRRPLCAYPRAARWTGRGGPNDEANFTCRN